VEGELFESRWQTKDGQKRSQIKLMANNVHFIYVKGGGQQ
jgi:single-stranded DNA-binding protein